MAANKQTVVVLGAGINGAALARELLLSGVSVVVVDSGDIACGATAWSTRLIHGGLRYLEYGEVGLVRESLAERDRLLRLAPHLVKPLRFYLPVEGRFGGLWAAGARLVGCESLARAWRGKHGRGSWTIAAGLTLYDLLSFGSPCPRHRMVRAGGVGLPSVDKRAFPLAGMYSDAQLLYPERFTVELLLDAAQIAADSGADFIIKTHHTARLLLNGRLQIRPVTLGFQPSDTSVIELRPAAVVNATGAWVDRTLDLLSDWGQPESPATSTGFFADTSGESSGAAHLIAGTKGSHLVVHSPRLREALGSYGVYAEAADGRPVFVLPFGDRLVLVGTTDIPYAGDPAEACTDEAEISYLLAAVARLFPAAAPDRHSVQQHYCGVRPLPFVRQVLGRSAPASVSRRHMLVRHPRAPLPAWSIVGGKLTTCRSLAEGAAAEVLNALHVPVQRTSVERPLPGACQGASRDQAAASALDSALRAGLSVSVARRVAEETTALFGARSRLVCAAMNARPDGLPPPNLLLPGLSLPVAAVGFCLREEWARNLEDLIERRLMLLFDERLSVAAIEAVAQGLVREQRLLPEQVGPAVAAYVSTCKKRYGRTLRQLPVAPQGSSESVE